MTSGAPASTEFDGASPRPVCAAVFAAVIDSVLA